MMRKEKYFSFIVYRHWYKRSLKMMMRLLSLFLTLSFTACSFNPFLPQQQTGHAGGALLGTVIGAGTLGIVGASKPLIILGGLGGGALGYYLTTLSFDAAGITEAGGKVYLLGEYIKIYLPSDYLFEPNTASFVPGAQGMLDSTIEVLKRQPNNKVFISAHTSGFASDRIEKNISEERARQVAFYLSHNGIGCTVTANSNASLYYQGKGSSIPISSYRSNQGIRTNSRIQIISYSPDLVVKKCPSPYQISSPDTASEKCYKDTINTRKH